MSDVYHLVDYAADGFSERAKGSGWEALPSLCGEPGPTTPGTAAYDECEGCHQELAVVTSRQVLHRAMWAGYVIVIRHALQACADGVSIDVFRRECVEAGAYGAFAIGLDEFGPAVGEEFYEAAKAMLSARFTEDAVQLILDEDRE